MYFIYTGKYEFFEQYRISNVIICCYNMIVRANGHGNRIIKNGYSY